jgi:uncharacterized protein (DUF2147 family)
MRAHPPAAGSFMLPSGCISLIITPAVDGIPMRRIYCFAAAAMLALVAIIPTNAADVTGLWLIQDTTARVRIFRCGELMCGNVVWLSQPLDAVTGKPQTDKLNADPEKRSRAMLGVAIFLGLQRNNEENKWVGRIYNPDDGSTYRGSIGLIDQSQLKVEGCVTIYCQTEIWTRIN